MSLDSLREAKMCVEKSGEAEMYIPRAKKSYKWDYPLH